MPASLDLIEVPVPCSVPWESMRGDDRTRFCGRCRKHVHDLSALTCAEAERLLRGATGELCVGFYRRPDGRVLTADCRKTRPLAVRLLALAAALLAVAAGAGWPAAEQRLRSSPSNPPRESPALAALRGLPGIGGFLDWLFPPPPSRIFGGAA